MTVVGSVIVIASTAAVGETEMVATPDVKPIQTGSDEMIKIGEHEIGSGTETENGVGVVLTIKTVIVNRTATATAPHRIKVNGANAKEIVLIETETIVGVTEIETTAEVAHEQ